MTRLSSLVLTSVPPPHETVDDGAESNHAERHGVAPDISRLICSGTVAVVSERSHHHSSHKEAAKVVRARGHICQEHRVPNNTDESKYDTKESAALESVREERRRHHSIDTKLRDTKRPHFPVLEGTHHVLLAKLTTRRRVSVFTSMSQPHECLLIIIQKIRRLCVVGQRKIRDYADHEAGNTFNNHDPAPAAHAMQAIHVTNTISQQTAKSTGDSSADEEIAHAKRKFSFGVEETTSELLRFGEASTSITEGSATVAFKVRALGSVAAGNHCRGSGGGSLRHMGAGTGSDAATTTATNRNLGCTKYIVVLSLVLVVAALAEAEPNEAGKKGEASNTNTGTNTCLGTSRKARIATAAAAAAAAAVVVRAGATSTSSSILSRRSNGGGDNNTSRHSGRGNDKGACNGSSSAGIGLLGLGDGLGGLCRAANGGNDSSRDSVEDGSIGIVTLSDSDGCGGRGTLVKASSESAKTVVFTMNSIVEVGRDGGVCRGRRSDKLSTANSSGGQINSTLLVCPLGRSHISRFCRGLSVSASNSLGLERGGCNDNSGSDGSHNSGLAADSLGVRVSDGYRLGYNNVFGCSCAISCSLVGAGVSSGRGIGGRIGSGSRVGLSCSCSGIFSCRIGFSCSRRRTVGCGGSSTAVCILTSSDLGALHSEEHAQEQESSKLHVER
ncbi:hypothetical protein HG530_012121 [Fusarium avenaceum]|nr:hypothetical protein HG530_012121 [Fusarium avenaceum]